jgi:hypothetical protein
MAKSRRKGPQRGPECERTRVREITRDELKAPRPETKNERRRREKEELLFENVGDAFEAYLRENSQRPKLPD